MTTLAVIDEVSRRKPEFVPGEPIILADNQAWHFPKPMVEYRLDFSGGAPRLANPAWHFGEAYFTKYEAFLKAERGFEQVEAVAALAADLLQRNYDLSAADLSALLPLREQDESNQAMWQAIADVALGNAKKAGSATSD